MYVRGSTADYDDWATLGEDQSWSAAKLAPYFRKHQTLDPIDPSIKEQGFMPFVEAFHGTEGPIHTSFNEWRVPFEDPFMRACDEVAGMKQRPKDPWSGDHIGFYSSLSAVDRTNQKGTRSYAASGYLAPNLGRPNLKVLTEALACNVILKDDTAMGVKFRHGGSTHEVHAKREIIVSAGAYQTPQILELSGIGDPDVLKAAGIECLIANPGVGANFQDHAVCVTLYELSDGHTSLDSLNKPELQEQLLKLYTETQAGALAATSCCMGFLPYSSLVSSSELEQTCASIAQTPNQTPFQKLQYDQIITHLKSPISGNLQLVLVPATFDLDAGYTDQSKLFGGPKTGRDSVTIAICLQYPASRGTIHITSSDPLTQPAIDPAFLTHPADVAVLAAGLEFCQRVAEAPHLTSQIAGRLIPEPEVNLFDREEAAKATRERVVTEYHPCGSCAMGEVVDGRLRVKGIKGLRVVDASIFPNHVSGNIMSSVYAVAEKAADMIKEDSAEY